MHSWSCADCHLIRRYRLRIMHKKVWVNVRRIRFLVDIRECDRESKPVNIHGWYRRHPELNKIIVAFVFISYYTRTRTHN